MTSVQQVQAIKGRFLGFEERFGWRREVGKVARFAFCNRIKRSHCHLPLDEIKVALEHAQLAGFR